MATASNKTHDPATREKSKQHQHGVPKFKNELAPGDVNPSAIHERQAELVGLSANPILKLGFCGLGRILGLCGILGLDRFLRLGWLGVLLGLLLLGEELLHRI